MTEVLLSYRGRKIGPGEVAFLRELIAQNPCLSRRKLSAEVCRAWNWVQPNGQLCDMVCRSLLLALDRGGHIQLPARRCRPPNNAIAHGRTMSQALVDRTPIQSSLAELGALEIRLARRTEAEELFGQLLQEHHYLGYRRPVGEHLKYLVLAGERPVACLAWSSAPRQLALRDEFLGRKKGQGLQLSLIAYNTRFLIAPWICVPHLASHLLGRMARRLSTDWQQLYGHPIYLLKSFVDTERFRGTCYRAANWRSLGCSQGRGTKAPTHEVTCSVKEYWVYPLSANFRQQLLG
jgi:hypothetical protein